MIDMHIHAVPPNLPGVGTLGPLLKQPAEAVAAQLRAEMAASGTTQVLGMGVYGATADDPLGVQSTLQLAQRVPGLLAIGIADPTRDDADHFDRVAAVLRTGRVVALKAYLGYVHCEPSHANYRRYYELCAQYKLPFIFHTGDTYSMYAKLKYAHPLLIDDVAVDHPNTRFVLAHLGNPWTGDAAEVVYKNVNVWADLSGLVVGSDEAFHGPDRADALHDLVVRLQQAFRYAERPNRFLYGSDWPLAPLTLYRDFIRGVIPPVYHEQVFEENARRLFPLG
jgi:hypothetical protein